MATQFIFFDLGNVILDFDRSVGSRTYAERWQVDPGEVDRVIHESGLGHAYESGDVSSAEFCATIRRELGIEATDGALLDATSDMFTPNLAVIALLGQLVAVGCPVGLLSNTCPAHWDWIRRRYRFVGGCFERPVLSYEVGAMKPAPEIYRAAIATADYPAAEIFFMDDRVENVDSALNAGIDAVHFRSAAELRSQLETRGVKFNG